jgi:hypothetical protein
MYETHLKQFDILKNKFYEETERKVWKEHKFREYNRKSKLLKTNFRKEEKIYGTYRNN